jgi:CRP-like cAMP-binding protein
MRATSIADAPAAWSLWVNIPRTEEVFELQVLGKVGARTVFVLQVSCKGAGSGTSQTWQLKKRYGYFERVHKLVTKCAEAGGVRPPELPRRKLIWRRDPKYLRTLREQLQLYLEQVIDLVQRTTVGSLDLATVLQQLELPIASESATWEQRSRFGVAADGKSLPVEMEGFLRKQGSSKSDVWRGWKDRWFVLAGSSLHYYMQPEAPTTNGVIELRGARVEEHVLGEEVFGIVVHDTSGRVVMLAATSASNRSEWLTALSAATSKPPTPPPQPSGPSNKRVAQLEAQRMQTKLVASKSVEMRDKRTLGAGDQVGGVPRLQLLLDAQGACSQWRGFSSSELEQLVEARGLSLQRFERGELVMKRGEAATFFGVVLQGTLAIDVGDTKFLKYPGQLVGEMALFNGGLRSADCSATSDGVIATMTFQQLEAMKASPELRTRAVAEKINLLIAHCALRKFLSEQQGVDAESVSLAEVDEDAELADLFKKQRLQNWSHPKSTSQLEAEAFLFVRTQQQQPPLPPPPPPQQQPARSSSDGISIAFSKQSLAFPRAGSSLSGVSGDGKLDVYAALGIPRSLDHGDVVQQGSLQLCFSKTSKMPPSHEAWARHWCVLIGRCLYLYTAPQQRVHTGVLALAPESQLRMSAQRHGQAAGVSSFHLKYIEGLVGQMHFKSMLLCAESNAETKKWAACLARQQKKPFAPAPSWLVRQAALSTRSSARSSVCASNVSMPAEELNVDLPHTFGLPAAALTSTAYRRASERLLQSFQNAESPFGEELAEGVTLWMLSKRTLTRVPVLPHEAQPSDAAVLAVQTRFAGGGHPNGGRRERGSSGERRDAEYGVVRGGAGCKPRVELHEDRAYLLLHAAPLDHSYEGDQLRVEVHYWCGKHATADAQGAVAIFAIHLQQLLEGEARLHREDQWEESNLFRSYFANDEFGIMYVNFAAVAPPNERCDFTYRRHERCCLWPRLPDPPTVVLYHVSSADCAPSRLDASKVAISGRLLDQSGGAFVLDVADSTDQHAGRCQEGYDVVAGTKRVRQIVWGGSHLINKPAAAERMTAVLFAYNLHNRDHHGSSQIAVLPDGTYAAGELEGIRRVPVGGAERALSSGVIALYFVRLRLANGEAHGRNGRNRIADGEAGGEGAAPPEADAEADARLPSRARSGEGAAAPEADACLPSRARRASASGQEACVESSRDDTLVGDDDDGCGGPAPNDSRSVRHCQSNAGARVGLSFATYSRLSLDAQRAYRKLRLSAPPMEGTKDVAEEDGTPEASEDEDVAAPKAGLHGRETAPRVPIPKPPEPPEPPEPLEPPLIEPPNAPTAGGPPKPAMEPAMATTRSPLEPDGDEDGAAEVEGAADGDAWALELTAIKCGGGRPDPKVLHSTAVVVVHTEAQIFVWAGAHSVPFQRWAGAELGRALTQRAVPGAFGLCRTVEGAEPAIFTSLFAAWEPTSTARLVSSDGFASAAAPALGLGLRWKDVGENAPLFGTEFVHATLVQALERKLEASPVDSDAVRAAGLQLKLEFGFSDFERLSVHGLRTDSYVRAGGRCLMPATALAEWPMSLAEVCEIFRHPPPPSVLNLEGLGADQQSGLTVWQISSQESPDTAPDAEPVQHLEPFHSIFRSDRCYMVLHTYLHALTRRKMHELFFWVGKHADRFYFMVWRFQLTGQMAQKASAPPCL